MSCAPKAGGTLEEAEADVTRRPCERHRPRTGDKPQRREYAVPVPRATGRGAGVAAGGRAAWRNPLCSRAQDWQHHPMPTTPATEQRLRELALLRKVRDRIDRDYAQPLDVEALARGVHLSAGHLSRQFRRAYGESPYSYLMTRRIERAMALLRAGELSVTEVCFAVGCSSLGTFSTRFSELVGISPSQYGRLAARGGDGGAAGGVDDVHGLPSCVAQQVMRPRPHRSGSEKPTPAPRT